MADRLRTGDGEQAAIWRSFKVEGPGGGGTGFSARVPRMGSYLPRAPVRASREASPGTFFTRACTLILHTSTEISMTDVSPAATFKSFTPSDDPADNFDRRPRAIYVGTGGTVVAVNNVGEQVTFLNVANGTELHIRPTRIHATGTTASGFIQYV